MRTESEQVDFPLPSSYCRLKYRLILTGISFPALLTHFIPPPTLFPTSPSPNTISLMNCLFRTLRNLLIHLTSHPALFSWSRHELGGYKEATGKLMFTGQYFTNSADCHIHVHIALCDLSECYIHSWSLLNCLVHICWTYVYIVLHVWLWA